MHNSYQIWVITYSSQGPIKVTTFHWYNCLHFFFFIVTSWKKVQLKSVTLYHHYKHVFFGRNDAKAETPVLWPPHVKSWLIGKDSDVGRDCGQEEKGTTEDEMAGWHHWLDGRESEWTPGVGGGQGGLACCNSWARKESDTTERNWTEACFHTVISLKSDCILYLRVY